MRKSRCTVEEYPHRRAEYHSYYKNTDVFKASCNKPDKVVQYETEKLREEDSSVPLPVYLEKSEVIDTVVKRVKYPKMNPCNHLKQQWIVNAGDRLQLRRVTQWDEDDDFRRCAYPIRWYGENLEVLDLYGMSELYDVIMNSGDQPNLVDPFLLTNSQEFKDEILTLDRIALSVMIPQLDDGFSLPRSLVELLELKQLWEHAFESLAMLPGKLLRLFSKHSLNELSQHFLAGIFGWAPFVRDIKTFVERYQNISEDVSKYLEGANKRKTLHYEKYLSPYTFRPEAWFDTTDSHYFYANVAQDEWWFARDLFREIGVNLRIRRRVQDLSFHATLDYAYLVPELHPGLLQFLAEMQRWGFKSRSVSDAWELIPFSFVVDWFIGIGPWLRKFDKDLLQSAVLIYQYSHSIKYRMRETAHVEPELSTFIDSNGADKTALWQVTPFSGRATHWATGYYRAVGNPRPAPEDLPNWKTPKGLSWVILGALAASKKK